MALEPSEAVRDELAAWRDELVADRDDLRPVRPAALHVTLVFLGWQYEKDVERIAETTFSRLDPLSGALLTPAAVRPLPPRRPRLFALDLDDEDNRCTAVQAAASDALEGARFYKPEKRPFWPHMTLARVKRDRRAAPLEPSSLPPSFEARRVTLYRSTLRPQGAIYDALATYEL